VTLSPNDVRTVADRILEQVERAVIGKRDALELVLAAFVADGHVLLEDVPGVAKTLAAVSFARATSLTFSRIQFTPDLMPADVTGSSVLDPSRGSLEFRPGPIFGQLVLADEINRAPAKTQAALLEAMQERQVTADGVTRPLPHPFLVMATQNPIEYEGTYALPEAQLDRFILRTSFGYPSADDEWEMLDRRMARGVDAVAIDEVATPADLLALQQAVERVHVAPALGRYLVELVRGTRASSRVLVGASPRGALALLKLSRARAALDGRDFALPDDVKRVAIAALAHRLVLRTEHWVRGVTGEDVVRELLLSVPAPPATDLEPSR
jgi:MoxR-like ATPase